MPSNPNLTPRLEADAAMLHKDGITFNSAALFWIGTAAIVVTTVIVVYYDYGHCYYFLGCWSKLHNYIFSSLFNSVVNAMKLLWYLRCVLAFAASVSNSTFGMITVICHCHCRIDTTCVVHVSSVVVRGRRGGLVSRGYLVLCTIPQSRF